MPETKHTPGPWWVFQPGENDPCKGVESASLSIVLYGEDPDGDRGVKGSTQEERDANAYLIAAAPELYAIAREYFALLKSDYQGEDGRDLTGGRIAIVEAILAKARGEAPHE